MIVDGEYVVNLKESLYNSIPIKVLNMKNILYI